MLSEHTDSRVVNEIHNAKVFQNKQITISNKSLTSAPAGNHEAGLSLQEQ